MPLLNDAQPPAAGAAPAAPAPAPAAPPQTGRSVFEGMNKQFPHVVNEPWAQVANVTKMAMMMQVGQKVFGGLPGGQ